MASLTIRNLSDTTHRVLRLRAAEHGRSVEAEVRAILDAVARPRDEPGLGTMLAEIGREFGGVTLEVSRDKTPAEPPSFE